MGKIRVIFGMCAACVALAACAGDTTPDLMNLRAQGAGPDEFGIIPTAPLQRPEDLSALPPPTPGGANRTDRDPQAEAIVALGGRPGAGAGGDAGLIGTVTRFGVAEDIRGVLAAEDLQFRRDNDGRLAERLFNVNVYYRAYQSQSLDRYRELRRLRAAGIRTPAPPPERLPE